MSCLNVFIESGCGPSEGRRCLSYETRACDTTQVVPAPDAQDLSAEGGGDACLGAASVAEGDVPAAE
eukprot:6267232-Alexandrium_andersonii.AAC.1